MPEGRAGGGGGRGDLEHEERTTFHRGWTATEGRLKLYKLLKAGDKVVVETGNLAFLMAKEMERAVGCRVRVLSSHHLPVIYETDKEDSLKLAHLAADRPDSRLPIVPVPGEAEMESGRCCPVTGGRRRTGLLRSTSYTGCSCGPGSRRW